MRAALESCQRLFDEALPKVNWGSSFLDADAIKLLNDVPIQVRRALWKKFTVLLLRPDYQTENFGQDTYHAHVEAPCVATAIALARQEAMVADSHPFEDIPDPDEIKDYFVLAAYEGHIQDINPGE